ncbi:hypothetical protein [Thalassobius sp. I31.1]|uniref:hypothetical protein n=1 Tax=Thalassobius sp. I31.1 TaxID=2109912 RepID=UPI000D1AD2CF|nr:hypothetical protein [Thalassobius sp. I31.1]
MTDKTEAPEKIYIQFGNHEVFGDPTTQRNIRKHQVISFDGGVSYTRTDACAEVTDPDLRELAHKEIAALAHEAGYDAGYAQALNYSAIRSAFYDAMHEVLIINEHGDIEGISSAADRAIRALNEEAGE